MLISAGLLKIAPVTGVGGVWGDVCVTAAGEADRLSHVRAMRAPPPRVPTQGRAGRVISIVGAATYVILFILFFLIFIAAHA